jgi:hypothetical protein
MNKRVKSSRDNVQSTATDSGPRPGDYPAGSIESRAAARALLENRAGQLASEEMELTPFEEATAEDEQNPEVRKILIDLARLAEERAAVFGHELPTPEWVRYRRLVTQVANELSDGRCSKVQISDGREWSQWMRLAQEKLRERGICPPETPAPRYWTIFREVEKHKR